ncbi:hypothetical protein AC578_9767 [Lecanosticta acicola]|uniref:Zn(2)-C6 fungal-type domain-containing protein n=1 Tax=Lecanosticta acicola TaxID=111012 RepID=A0AAI8Z911_9PEZI|nr:hypothetical protein AC578_9767 [Lecanosticta acicola]
MESGGQTGIPMSEGASTSPAMASNTPDRGELKRKRQPRNSACQSCSALKMKCISTPNGKCERCNRMDRDCVPAIPKPRKRRGESGVGVDSEGVSLLEFAGPSTAAAGPPPKFDPPRQTQSEDVTERTSLLARHDLSHTDSKSFLTLFSQGLGNVAACEDLLQGVDYNFVGSCFTIFRQLAPHFPFVWLHPGADTIAMVARRPCLTLAICTVSSASNRDMQSRLSQAFQYTLSSKVILGGQRSLDLLTGLLVYLAWHHQYMSQPQIYQELYLLAGMAADLGVYGTKLEPLDASSALERDRAFVGCYYLCSGLSATGFDKPSPLRFSDSLRLCAERAAAANMVPSDSALVSLLELMHALTDMEDALREDAQTARASSLQFIDLHVRATNQRLKALKREHPALAGSLAFSAANIHIYQRLMRVSETPDYPTLIQCACSIKEYVDDILARPPSMLHRISITDWTNLMEILVLMARVSKAPPTTGGWEAGALTSMLQPEAGLDALCSHMASAPANDTLSPRHEQLLQWLRNVSDSIKRRFLHETGESTWGQYGSGDQRSSSDGRSRPGDEQARQPDILNFLGNGVLDFNSWSSLTAR